VSSVLGSAVSQVRPHFLRFAKTLHLIYVSHASWQFSSVQFNSHLFFKSDSIFSFFILALILFFALTITEFLVLIQK